MTPTHLLAYSGIDDKRLLISEASLDHKLIENEEEDLNDFDVKEQIAIASDVQIYICNLVVQNEKYELQLVTKLQKHENIILKVVWSTAFPGQLYSIGFDYKLVHHNVADQSKSVTRNVIQSMIAAMGPGSEK